MIGANLLIFRFYNQQEEWEECSKKTAVQPGNELAMQVACPSRRHPSLPLWQSPQSRAASPGAAAVPGLSVRYPARPGRPYLVQPYRKLAY